MFKQTIKHALRATWPGLRPPVLVASMGRSGSTLVYDSIIAGMAKVRFRQGGQLLQGVIRDEAWNLAGKQFRCGQVYKTHDFPTDLAANDQLRTIFLFGEASSAARSVLHCDVTRGRDWIAEHFEHLSANGTIDEIPDRDVLRFGEQLDTWLNAEQVPVLALRYEALWESGAADFLSRFVGFPVTLPVQKARASSTRDFGERDRQINATYAELDARVATLPTILVNDSAKRLIDTAGPAGHILRG